MTKQFLSPLIMMVALGNQVMHGDNRSWARNELRNMYEYHCRNWSDMVEHIPVLKEYARQCETVVEIGIRSMVSSWGVYQGLVEHGGSNCSYIGIDLAMPPADTLALAERLVRANGIHFTFIQGNDMDIDPIEADMYFIDSLHTYCHLTYELEKFSPYIKKYITMHDTSEPWGDIDDNTYHGDYSEYPAHIDRTKRGLWPAVEDFLKNHPEWELLERRLNCHGFTVLRRVA